MFVRLPVPRSVWLRPSPIATAAAAIPPTTRNPTSAFVERRARSGRRLRVLSGRLRRTAVVSPVTWPPLREVSIASTSSRSEIIVAASG